MTLARNIDRGVLVVALVALVLPAAAGANPLLSGYGSPGSGGQALLGSTLTGPRGGSGATEGAGGSTGEGAPASAIEAQGTSAGTSQQQASGTGHASARTHRSQQHRGSESTGAASSFGGGGPTQPGLARARSVPTDTAGLSSGDLALILLGIGVVAATGILMARLARGQEREGPGS
jgi:hypothetical protein